MAEGGATTLDLIQPHSVSAEEVASYYGAEMGKASMAAFLLVVVKCDQRLQ